jgi:diphthamide synthase (EF-2-diphthine--ammonia ligase)
LDLIKKTFLSWSSGKDAALALYKLQQTPGVHVQKLLTTINSHYERVSMHGLRVSLLDRQLSSLGIPLHKVELPQEAGMDVYNRIMETALNQLAVRGVLHMVPLVIFF